MSGGSLLYGPGSDGRLRPCPDTHVVNVPAAVTLPALVASFGLLEHVMCRGFCRNREISLKLNGKIRPARNAGSVLLAAATRRATRRRRVSY